mmetsp:Transcript_1517/g.5194  ORF Transcript_1517/g.5194 Transcript_1517/m.5194 type:complete len:340 (-) Transcript_1517:38-1057(-)
MTSSSLPSPDFFQLESQLLRIEDECLDKAPIPDIMKQFFILLVECEKKGTFSRNEELDDILSKNVKYLLLSFYISKCLQLLKSDGIKQRHQHLDKAKHHVDVFLSRCSDYRLITNEQQKLIDQDAASVDPSTSRTQRIQSERTKLELKKKIQYLKFKKEKISATVESDELDELEREIYLEKVRMAVVECILGKRIMEQELQLLKFAAMREESGEPALKPEPPKPLKVTKLTKDHNGQIHAENIKAPTASMLSYREQVKKDVFKPRSNGPTMSLEEYAQHEMQDAQERSERERACRQKEKEEHELIEQEDEDAWERKRKKDAAWDDWKDANPKGQGNMRK